MDTKESLIKLLETEYKIYSYLTIDNDPGTIIADQRLQKIFDDNKLFTMDNVVSKSIKLKDILEKGYISIGSVDLMESLNINCPHPDLGMKPKINGRYMHGSRKELISKPTNIDFEYDVDSDTEVIEDKKEYFDFDEEDQIQDTDKDKVEAKVEAKVESNVSKDS